MISEWRISARGSQPLRTVSSGRKGRGITIEQKRTYTISSSSSSSSSSTNMRKINRRRQPDLPRQHQTLLVITLIRYITCLPRHMRPALKPRRSHLPCLHHTLIRNKEAHCHLRSHHPCPPPRLLPLHQ